MTALHHKTGRVLNQMDLTNTSQRIGYPYAVVDRDEVLDRLLDPLGDNIVYGRRCVETSTTPDRAEVVFEDGEHVSADLVVAADGAGSSLRRLMWPDEPSRFLSVAWQSTAGHSSSVKGSGEATLIWGRDSFAGLFPDRRGHLGWFLDQRQASASPADENPRTAIMSRFGWLPDLFLEVHDATPDESIQSIPIYVRRPPKRWSAGRVAIVGDAAHTVSPSAGQGASEAFIDAVALAYAFGHRHKIDEALKFYTRLRALRSQAI